MQGIKPDRVLHAEPVMAENAAVTDFGLRLFRQAAQPETNTLISPLSVLYALSMTANGAQGNTLSQMESVLGMPVEELNTWLHIYLANLPEADMQIVQSIVRESCFRVYYNGSRDG